MATKGKYGRIIFSEKDIAFVKANFKTMTNQQIADALGEKKTKVRMLAYSLGLKRMELQYWTTDQINFLKANYQSIGDVELAEIFNVKWYKNKGWTRNHIEKKRRYLNLKRTQQQLQYIQDRNVLAGRFSTEKANKARSLKQTPIGATTIWFTEHNLPYVVIKQKEGFVPYNRYLWQKKHGPIPKGSNVVLKPNANRTDYTVTDLELLTNAQLAFRNQSHKVPDELKEVLRLSKKLNKLITKKKQDAK